MEDDLKDGENIVMFDDEGNEANFQVLSAQEFDGVTYLLAEEILEEDEDLPDDSPESDEDELAAEVMIFKCVANGTGEEDDEEGEMVFELVDEEHEDFNKAMEIFKEDFKTLEIEIGE